MSVNPSDPTDMAILNFFSQCGVRPDHVEHPAFITMARALRAAPKNYALPVLNRHANSAHNPYPPANNMLAARNSINNNHEGNGNGNGNNINNMLNSGAGPGPSNSSGSSSSGGGEMGVYGGMNNAASVPTYEDHHAHMSTGAEDGGTGGEGGEGDVGGDGEGGEEEGDVDSSDSEDNSTQPENLM